MHLGYVPTENVKTELLQAVQHDVEMQNNMDGTFLTSLKISRSGLYQFKVQVNQVDVHQSPFELLVLPEQPFPGLSLALISQTPSFPAGEVISFSIQSRDRFGNAQSALSYPLYPPISFHSTLMQSGGLGLHQGQIVDLETGRYSVRFGNDGSQVGSGLAATLLVTAAGKYEVAASDSGSPVGGTPFVLNVVPGEVSAPDSFISVALPSENAANIDGLLVQTTAGAESGVYVKPRDRFGNGWTTEMMEAIDIVSTRSLDVNSTDSEGTEEYKASWASFYDGAGNYRLELSSTRSGNYLIDVLVAELPIGNSPFTYLVDPDAAVGDLTFLTIPLPAEVVAGKETNFVVQPVDR